VNPVPRSLVQGVLKNNCTMVFQCYCVASVTKTLGVQTIHLSTPWTIDSLYAFKRKGFHNIRHTVTFGIPLQSCFWNTLHYQWKSHWTVTIPGKTRCVLLHYDSSKHCTCPLNKFIQVLKVVKLFLKHVVWNGTALPYNIKASLCIRSKDCVIFIHLFNTMRLLAASLYHLGFSGTFCVVSWQILSNLATESSDFSGNFPVIKLGRCHCLGPGCNAECAQNFRGFTK
jgi:hypothetical protein